MHISTLHPSQKSLREVQQILNSTEGNFHQLVALLNCRGLNKVQKDDAVAKLRQPMLDRRAPHVASPPLLSSFVSAGLR